MGAEMEEAEAAGRRESELSEEAEGNSAAAKARRRSAPPENEPDPDTVEGWAAAQQRLFGGLHPLPKGWIRMRSKTKGLIYYYNLDSGESKSTEPKEPQGCLRARAAPISNASLPTPKTVEEWITAQERLFPGLPSLPPEWIRMRSQSKGTVYFYHTRTGESTGVMPTK